MRCLARVKIHNLVSGLEAVGSKLSNFVLDIGDRKTNMVHANLVQIADVRIG